MHFQWFKSHFNTELNGASKTHFVVALLLSIFIKSNFKYTHDLFFSVGTKTRHLSAAAPVKF